MAQMFPAQFPAGTPSPAERLLYESFRDQLDEEYAVFHSCRWQALDGEGRPRDGEADFILAHPQRGILVLEAKGGVIRVDPRQAKWTSIDQGGHPHLIKDPFYQARNGKYALLDALKKRPELAGRDFNLGYAVALPEVDVLSSLPGLDKPREIILDRGDLLNLSRWVGAALGYYRGEETRKATAPGDAAVPVLMEILSKARELRPTLWGDIRRQEEAFIQLTEQQYQLLDLLNRQRRALISGCAGSGKTTLALEKARRLADQGFRVLFTCFNKGLAADVRARLGDEPNLHVDHFHELCHLQAERAGIALPDVWSGTAAEQQDFFDNVLPEALWDAAEALPDLRFDAVIVDEGQDFQDHWWPSLQRILEDPEESILYIFFDDNQRLYEKLGTFPIDTPPFTLTVNCRNTQAIHAQVVRCYQGSGRPPAVRGPKGRPVERIPFADGELLGCLSGVLERLVEEERVPAEEVVVLSPIRKHSRLWAEPLPGRLKLADEWPTPPGHVFATTIQSFKGLESSVVVLAEAERGAHWGSDLEALLYVAYSRARHHLILLHPAELPESLRPYFG